MTIAETINYPDGYKVKVRYDEDADNPLKESEGGPILVLHSTAEGRFGWTTDDDWASRLNGGLENILERGFHPQPAR